MFWYTFLMAFPVLLIIQNVSFFLFPFLLLGMYNLTGRVIVFNHLIQILIIAFGLGAVVSYLNMPGTMSSAATLNVLPNYIYWMLLLLFFTSFTNYIHLPSVYKGVVMGILFSILYFFLLQRQGFTSFPLFKNLSQNTFAFLLICFTPLIVWYFNQRYGFWTSVAVLLILVLSGFLSGSRSGSLLTLSGGVLSILINRKGIGRIFMIGLVLYILIAITINTQFAKNLIRPLNERTYDLIYDRDKTLQEDRSYLVRLAQIEKSILIFEKYPITGIGLNNFSRYQVKLPGNFVGSEYVINKKSIDDKSAHNSYFGLLAEGGLMVFIPFAALLLYNIGWFLVNLNRLKPEYRPVFVSIVHMCIHLYFIYAILNVFAWFLIGLGCFTIVSHKR